MKKQKYRYYVVSTIKNMIDNDEIMFSRKEEFKSEKDAVAYITDYSLYDAKNYNLTPDQFTISKTRYENYKTGLFMFISYEKI